MPSGDFDTSGDMPLLCHATYAIASIPVFVWYVPAIIVVLTVGGLSHGEGLLARAPLPRGRKFLLEGAVGAVLVVIVLACAYAPSALIALVRNGVGNPSYPIFCSVDGTLFLLPALDSYIGAGVVLLFGNVLVYFAALAIGCLLHSLSVGALLAFLLPVSTMTEAFAGAVPSFLSDALPTTYLDPSVLFGHAGGFPSAAVEAVNHASPVIACAVQLLWIVAIAVVACTALRVSISPWPKRARW